MLFKTDLVLVCTKTAAAQKNRKKNNDDNECVSQIYLNNAKRMDYLRGYKAALIPRGVS